MLKYFLALFIWIREIEYPTNLRKSKHSMTTEEKKTRKKIYK